MIEIVGWIDVAPSSRDELVAASIALQRATRADEIGCGAYVFAADPAVPGRIHVYEQWATAEDLDAHFRHPNFQAMRGLLRGYPRVGSQTMKHLVARTGPVNDPEGTASATYWPPEA